MWPDGKKHSRNVYAKTREECEALLPGLIEQMKAEIKAIKESRNLDAIPDGISEKKKAIAAYSISYFHLSCKIRLLHIGSKKKKVVHFCTTFKTNLQIIKKWVGPYRTHPWSECNYRTWKNPVISMVLAQQARGFYPIRYDN